MAHLEKPADMPAQWLKRMNSRATEAHHLGVYIEKLLRERRSLAAARTSMNQREERLKGQQGVLAEKRRGKLTKDRQEWQRKVKAAQASLQRAETRFDALITAIEKLSAAYTAAGSPRMSVEHAGRYRALKDAPFGMNDKMKQLRAIEL